MFSFHKPKIYRSNNGCCICKAKSSSSRFTDSKKYEAEFERCFQTKEIRSGKLESFSIDFKSICFDRSNQTLIFVSFFQVRSATRACCW